MVIDICCGNARLATLSCDEGIHKARIVLFDKQSPQPTWDLDLKSFLSAVDKAVQELKEANNISSAIPTE